MTKEGINYKYVMFHIHIDTDFRSIIN